MSPEPGAGGAAVKQQEPLKPYTTFEIGGPARYFVRAATAEDFRAALALATREELPLFILGGGSNILVSDRGYEGVVAHPVLGGIEVAHEDSARVTLEVNAGETWDDVVAFAVERNWWGIENLSHIPGQAGAALVQNIGAYGQQISDVLESAEVMDATTGVVRVLAAEECALGYRRSIFNTSARGKLIILRLRLRLGKRARPHLGYPDLKAHFAAREAPEASLPEIRRAVITIRDRKFPFPREERGGNAGSFFKNLSLTEEEFAGLRGKIERNFPAPVVERLDDVRSRFASSGRIKIPTAFLIEICGLKGHRIGGAQVNETQPLVLLNQGGATAEDVLTLARHVRHTVYEHTGMTISIEPELVGFTEQEVADLLGGSER
jgi:UDP-N-acetylmuramate dehydrogenase